MMNLSQDRQDSYRQIRISSQAVAALGESVSCIKRSHETKKSTGL
jgi:hypothetical protein